MRSTLDHDGDVPLEAMVPPFGHVNYDESHPVPPLGDWWACHFPERPYEAEHTLLSVEDCRACRIYLDSLARMFPKLGMVTFEYDELHTRPELRRNNTTMAEAAKIWPIDLDRR